MTRSRRWVRTGRDRQRAGTALRSPVPARTVAAERTRSPQVRTNASTQARRSDRYTEALLNSEIAATERDPAAAEPGPPLDRGAPFLVGVLAALGLCTGLGIVLAVVRLSDVITWVIISFFIALGLDPIVSRLVRLGLRRGWAVLILISGVLAILALLGWLIVPPILQQGDQLIHNAPGYVDQIQHNHWVQQINHRWHPGDQLLNHFKGSLNEKTVTSLLGGLASAGVALAHGVTATFSVVVLTSYFVAAMPTVKTAAYKMVPRSRRPRVMYLGEEISRRVGYYILGQLCVAAINAAFAYCILRILGLPFPAVLATIVGLLALIPIVGTLVGAVIMILVALTAGWFSAVVMAGYYVAYHLFETYVLAPRIMHRVVHVPSVVTIVAVIAGGTLRGIVGALLAIPIAAGLLLLYDQVLVTRQEQH